MPHPRCIIRFTPPNTFPFPRYGMFGFGIYPGIGHPCCFSWSTQASPFACVGSGLLASRGMGWPWLPAFCWGLAHAGLPACRSCDTTGIPHTCLSAFVLQEHMRQWAQKRPWLAMAGLGAKWCRRV